MADVETYPLVKLIPVILVIIIVLFIVAPLFGFDLVKYISVVPTAGENISQPVDTSNVNKYKNFELSYDGMTLLRGAGDDDITKELSKHVTVINCTSCQGCSGVDFNGDSRPDEWECTNCDNCEGTSSPGGRFANCIGCSSINGENCSICDDTSDYELCKRIRDCIMSYNKDENGCILRTIHYSDNATFDIDAFKSILQNCDGSINLYAGNNMTKELCQINNAGYSFFEYKANDFFMNYKINEPFVNSGFDVKTSNKVLTPFYLVNGTPFERYRIYISFFDSDSQNSHKLFDVKAGYEGKECKLGSIETDSNGFGEAEFNDLSDCDFNDKRWIDLWEENPNDYALNKVKIIAKSGNPTLENVSVIFYVNSPESEGAWINEMRYSYCNFDTDPEPYSSSPTYDRPWWAKNNPVESYLYPTWFTQNYINNPVNVFYDFNIPGAEAKKISQTGNIVNFPIRGNLKLELGRFYSDFSNDCKFDIYVCTQSAFAEQQGESILSLVDFLTNFNPLSTYNITYDGNKNIIKYNYFEFNLNKNYTVEEVKSAIETGFRFWEQNTFLYNSKNSALDWLWDNNGIYTGAWNERFYPSINYDNDCWSGDLDNLISKNNKRFLIGGCENNNCSGKIKMRVAFKYIKPDSSSTRDFLYPMITFCGTGVLSPPTVECNDHVDNNGNGFCDTLGSSCTDGSIPGDPYCLDAYDPKENPDATLPDDRDSWTEDAAFKGNWKSSNWGSSGDENTVGPFLSTDHTDGGSNSIKILSTYYAGFDLPFGVDTSTWNHLSFSYKADRIGYAQGETSATLAVVLSDVELYDFISLRSTIEDAKFQGYHLIVCPPPTSQNAPFATAYYFDYNRYSINTWNSVTLNLNDNSECQNFGNTAGSLSDIRHIYIVSGDTGFGNYPFTTMNIDHLNFWYKE